MSGNQHATNLLRIASVPAVRERLSLALDTFAGNAPELIGWQGSSRPDAGRLRPLLDDMVKYGGTFARRDVPGQPCSWMLSVPLPADRAEVWKKNLAAWLAPGNPAAITSLPPGALDGWETKLNEQDFLFLAGKENTTLACGPLAKERLAELQSDPKARSRFLAVGPPILNAYGDAPWFYCTADATMTQQISRFTRRLLENWIEGSTGTKPPAGGGEATHSPALALSVFARDNYVRTHLELTYAQSLGTKAAAWQVPTNSIRDPLISFCAIQPASNPAQRLLPWLGPQDFLPLVGLGKAPGQMFAWGLGDVPFQSYVALPLADATNHMAALATDLESRWGDTVKTRALGRLSREEKSNQLSWVGGLPMVVPFLAPSSDANYLTAGIFPVAPGTNAMPQELVAQITANSNLVYYSWEITQGRMVQWKLLGQLLSMLHPPDKGVPGVPIPPMPLSPAAKGGGAWLNDLGKELGNSVTEITLESPEKLLLTRKSHSGLTALEWVLVDNWFSNPGFPLFHTNSAPSVALPKPVSPAPAPPKP